MVLLYMLTLCMIFLQTSLASSFHVETAGNQRGNDYFSWPEAKGDREGINKFLNGINKQGD